MILCAACLWLAPSRYSVPTAPGRKSLGQLCPQFLAVLFRWPKNLHDHSENILYFWTQCPDACAITILRKKYADSEAPFLYLGTIRVSVQSCSHIWSRLLIPVDLGQL